MSELGHVPVKLRLVLAGENGKLLHAQGGRDPSTPSQAPQLDPGDKDCWGQLGVENHMGGNENPTRRQQREGHNDVTWVVSSIKQIEKIILPEGVRVVIGYMYEAWYYVITHHL